MKTKFTFIAYSLLIGAIMFSSIVVGFSKNNPLFNFNENQATFISAVLPQGWGFFTKNPKESVYIIESHDKAEEILLPNMDYRNLFGIVRKGRAQGVEFGKVLSQIPEEAWESCENIDCSIDYILNNNSFTPVDDDTPRPLLQGQYIIYEKTVVPWHYSKHYEDSYQTKRYAKVYVK